MNYKQAIEHASKCQMAADEMAFIFVTKKKWVDKISAFQDYCDFNAMNTFGILKWNVDAIDFVIKNGKELTRKFTLIEFLIFARRYRIITIKMNPKTFAEFKKIKIKHHETKI